MKTKIFLSLLFCSIAFFSLSVDYYWIGGSGSWSEQSHWSLTSGGTATTTMPGVSDNIIIDANSGAASFIVSIDIDITVLNITVENASASIHVDGNDISCDNFVVIDAEELEILNSNITIAGDTWDIQNISTLNFTNAPITTTNTLPFTFNGHNEIYNDLISFSTQLTIDGSTFDLLKTNELGAEILISNAETLTIDSLNINTNCNSHSIIKTVNPTGVAASIRKTGYNQLHVSFLDIDNVNAINTGGYTYTTLSGDVTNATGWTIKGRKLFWIGDGGNWTDLNHWSLTSGGVPDASCIPKYGDSVIFDHNSFSIDSQIVVVNEEAFASYMSWNDISFNAVLNLDTMLYINGDIILNQDLTISPTEFIDAIEITGVSIVDIQGATVNCNIFINTVDSDDVVHLGSDLIQGDSLGVFIRSGEFNLNNFDLKSNFIFASPDLSSKVLDFTSSSVVLSGEFNAGIAENFSFNAGTSSLFIGDSINSNQLLTKDLSFNEVTLNFKNNGDVQKISGNNVFNKLTILKDNDITIDSTTIQKVISSLEMLGNCADSIFISSTDSSLPVTINFEPTATTDIFAVHLNGVNATGITPPLQHSSNTGIETGWDFSTAPTITSFFTLSNDDCYGDTVHIQNLSTVHTGDPDDMTIKWYFNDGSGYFEYNDPINPTDSTWIEYIADTNKYVFASSGSFNVTLEVTNNLNFCTTQHSELFYVKNPSTFLTSSSLNQEICQGELVEFVVSSDTSVAEFQFYVNNNPVGPLSSNNVFETTNINDGDIISVQSFFDNCPSTSIPQLEFVVNDLPTFEWNVTPSNAILCESDAFTFEAQIIGTATDYIFQYLKNGSPVSVGATYTTNQLNDNDLISLVARDQKNCRDTISQIFTVSPLPAVSLSSSITTNTICQGDLVNFTASGANEYEFFVNGASQSAPSTLNTFSTSSLSSGDVVTVIGTSNFGCSASAPESFSYYVNPLPTVNLSADQSTVLCSGTTVNFSASGSSQYEFFINGVSVQGPSPTNTYSSSSLIDQDNVYVVGIFSGCNNTSAPIEFTVLDAPTTDLVSDASGNTVCRNTPVTFTASGAFQYEFFLNGVSLGSPSSNNIYTTDSLLNGQTVTVMGANGTCELSKSVTTQVLPTPSVNIFSSVTSNTVCEGESITFTGTNSAFYELFIDDVSQGTPQTSAFFTETLASGSYQVKIVGTGANGCSSVSNDTLTVTVNPIPTINVISSVPTNEICEGETVILNVSGADQYQLFIDNIAQGGYTTSNNFTLNQLQNGQTASVVGNTLGCISNPFDHTFIVKPKPVMTLVGTATNNTFCEDVVETYQATGANNYEFFVNNISQGPLSPNDNISTNGFAVGTYPIKVVGELNNCVDSTEVYVTVNPSVVVSLQASDNVVCAGDNVTYFAGGGSLYEFFVNGVSQGTPTTFNSFASNSLQDGDVVSVVVSSSQGCTESAVATPITVNQVPIVTLTNTGNNTICTGEQVELIGSGANNYEFFVNGISQGTTTNPIFTSNVLENGDEIKVKGDLNGCLSTSSAITINVNQYPNVNLINNNSTELCEGELTDLTATGADEYQFSINGVPVGAYSSNPHFTSSLSDNDVVSVSGKLNDCASTASQSINFTVYQYPILNVTTSSPTAIICKDEMVTFNTTGAMTYGYYLNNNLMQSGTNPDFEIESLENGDEITIIGYNAHCSSAPVPYTFTVNSMDLQLNASPSNMVCNGTPISFTANGADAYQFYVNGVAQGAFSSNNSFTLNDGVNLDEVTFIGQSNSTLCEQEHDNIITINIIEEPVISANSPYEFCERDSVILYSNSHYGNQWYYNGSPISGATDSIFIAFLDGNYSLEVTHGGDGNVWTRGDNGSGVYGDSTNLNQLSPVRAISNESYKQVLGGSSHVIALTNSGDVYTWGKNDNGQLGDGTYSNKNYPKQVASLSNIKSVATAYQSNIAITNGGEIYVWGKNDLGQLGTGSNMVINFPFLNTNITDVDTIAAGENHFVILKNDGTVWTMGANTAGQLGNGGLTNSSVPVQVSTLSNIVSVGAGKSSSFAIDNTGILYVWGGNEAGQLGLGNTTSQTTPIVNSFKRVKQAVGGSKHSLFLVEGNQVYASGDNSFGQLGTGDFTNHLSPIKVNIGGVATLSARKNTSLLLKGDNNVFGFGNNEYNQLSESGVTAINTVEHIDKVEGATYINVSEKSSHFVFGVSASCITTSVTDITVHPVQDVFIIYDDNLLSTNITSANVSYQWYLNGLAIPGAVNSTYIATTGGNYSVEVTFEGGCPIMSPEEYIEILGVKDLEDLETIQGYPNPTSNNYTIALNGNLFGQKVNISIHDRLGRKIEEIQTIASDFIHLEFSRYNAGSYQVVIQNDAITKVLHVIKID